MTRRHFTVEDRIAGPLAERHKRQAKAQAGVMVALADKIVWDALDLVPESQRTEFKRIITARAAEAYREDVGPVDASAWLAKLAGCHTPAGPSSDAHERAEALFK